MKDRAGRGADGARGSAKDSIPTTVLITYPEDAPCPLCEERPGTEPGFCHLLPSDADPVSVLIYFTTCEQCDAKARAATGEAHEELSKATVQFFDRWLELSFGQRRGAA